MRVGGETAVAVLGFHDGSAGQIAEWFEESTGYRIACFVLEAEALPAVDAVAQNLKRVTTRMEYPAGASFKGRPLIAAVNWPEELRQRGITRVLPLTPDNRERAAQLDVCRRQGFELVSAIHPSVRVLEGATVEVGVWANAGVIIGYKAEVRAGALLNTGAQIDHHNVLEECCQVDPGVVMAGNVTLRRRSHVHTGATIINRIEIGEDAVIGAGAVVIDDIPAGCTAVGVPARVIKTSASARGLSTSSRQLTNP